MREHAFDTATKMMATVHAGGDGYLFAVKGAPEAVLAAATRVIADHGDGAFDDERAPNGSRAPNSSAITGCACWPAR